MREFKKKTISKWKIYFLLKTTRLSCNTCIKYFWSVFHIKIHCYETLLLLIGWIWAKKNLILSNKRKMWMAYLLGVSMSSLSGCRLKGSVALLSKCLMITALSITIPDGSLTGSSIRVSISGSRNSSGASP